jgi:hypothetical protein
MLEENTVSIASAPGDASDAGIEFWENEVGGNDLEDVFDASQAKGTWIGSDDHMFGEGMGGGVT